jgi:aspartate-semialdehyde dehydrogenase
MRRPVLGHIDIQSPVDKMIVQLNMNRQPHVAVVGATGAVGIEMIQTLERRNFPVSRLTLLASARSVGKRLRFRGEEIPVQELKAEAFRGVDLALFSAGSGISRQFAPEAVKAGCVVVDNSSAFRMEETVPLVVPEINAEDVRWHRGIIANPNCTTAITLMALYPLHKAFGCRRIFASSYQAVSGTGAKAIAELEQQVRQIVQGEPVTREVYPHQIAFNVLPHVDVFLPNGYTKEEMKMQDEGRKIMHHPGFRASVTCVRVPVYRAHSVAVSAEFEKPVSVEAALEVLRQAPGLDVIDDPARCQYPMPLDRAGKDNCAVGRIRKDCALDNGLCFWVCGDQLLKGAALNAVQIAETLLAI